MEIIQYSPDEVNQSINEFLSWSQLWYEDLEEAGAEKVFFAFDGDDIVGFQTINIDNRCIAIEVKDDYMGKGIARSLVEESGCNRPERNENPEFWQAVA
jgi:hypothetical protein